MDFNASTVAVIAIIVVFVAFVGLVYVAGYYHGLDSRRY
jgi:hypothetical protein